ncbi:MAG TPA: RNA methyltransferase [bacterium]|nr:RNA methyltransferase [bacterium]
MPKLPPIESVQNGMVKHAYSLKIPKKAKETEDFLCEGFHLVQEAQQSGLRVRFIFGTAEGWATPEGTAILEKAQPEKTKCFEVPSKIIAYVSDTVTPQGMLAVVGKIEARYPVEPYGPVLALHQLQDAGNLGTIFRSAEAFGVQAVFLTEGCCDPFNPKVVRSSMGSLFRVPFVQGGKWEDYQAWFKERAFQTCALSQKESQDLLVTELSDAAAFWIGSEGAGLPDRLVQDCRSRLRIPMVGKNESLNAAVAASLAMFWAKFGKTKN